MDNMNTPELSKLHGKKELRKQLADKIAAAIPELKASLGEKKFDSRIKKAVKHITEGMHKKEKVKAVKKAKAVAKKVPAKKAAVKKTAKAVKKSKSIAAVDK